MVCKCTTTATLNTHSVAVAGQSNGEFLGAWGITDYNNEGVDGSLMTAWAEGSQRYDALVAAIAAFPKAKGVWIYWVHGEADSILQVDADAYATRFAAFKTALEAEPLLSGYTINWIVVELHEDLIASRAYQATVRAALITVADANANMYRVNFDSYDLSADEIHHHNGTQASRQQDLDSARMSA